jgi:hypothetical protein
VKLLAFLATGALRLGCARLLLLTVVGWPWLLALQKRAAARPPASEQKPNPFTYRLQ